MASQPAEREFYVFLTAPREKKVTAGGGGKKVKKKFALRAKNKKTPKMHKKHPPKTNKNTKKKHPKKKKIRADARKISPNAQKKSQFPWPRRGHQTGKIPALGLGGASGFNYFDYFDLENWWAARAASRANSTTAEPAKAVKKSWRYSLPMALFFCRRCVPLFCFVFRKEVSVHSGGAAGAVPFCMAKTTPLSRVIKCPGVFQNTPGVF